jgi:hypothetical protein
VPVTSGVPLAFFMVRCGVGLFTDLVLQPRHCGGCG